MLDYSILQIINDIKRAVKTFAVHNDYTIKNVGMHRFVADKRIVQQIEKEVMTPIRRKNNGFYCTVTPMDNKMNYYVNAEWALDITIFNAEDEMELYMMYSPMRDTVIYYLSKDGCMYIHRNNRVEMLSVSKTPSSLASVDLEVINNYMKYSVIRTLPQYKLAFNMICSGSVLTDVMDLLLGRRACLFIGEESFRTSDVLNFLRVVGFDIVAVNGICIVTNVNAKEIVTEEVEEGE